MMLILTEEELNHYEILENSDLIFYTRRTFLSFLLSDISCFHRDSELYKLSQDILKVDCEDISDSQLYSIETLSPQDLIEIADYYVKRNIPAKDFMDEKIFYYLTY